MPTNEPKAASPVVALIWSPMRSPRFPVEMSGQCLQLGVPVAGECGEELLCELHRGGLQPVADAASFPGFGDDQAGELERYEVLRDALPRDGQPGREVGRGGWTCGGELGED